MATQKEEVQIHLKIVGIEEFKSLKDLNAQIIAQRKAVEKMDKNDLGYAAAAEKLRDMIRIQKEWKEEVYRTKQAIKENNKEVKSGWDAVRSIASGSAIGSVIADGFKNASAAVKDFVVDAVKSAAEAQGVMRAFARLNNPNLLIELRNATQGTVTDLELMKSAVNFNNFQLPLDKLGLALKFAHERARDTGQSVDYLVQSIVTGVARKSPLILDNLGINIKRINEEFQKTGDFAKAAFKIVEEELAKTSGNVENSADILERTTSKFKNIQTNVGLWMAGATNMIGDSLNKALTWIERVTAAGTDAEKMAKAYKGQANEIKSLESNLIPLAERYDILQAKTKKNRQEQTELNKIIDQIRKIMPDAATQWSKLGDVIGISTQKIRENIKELKAANAILNKDAISENEIQLRDYERRVAMYIKQLEQGTKVKVDQRGLFPELVPLTKEDRIKLDRQLREAQDKVLGYKKILKDLRGELDLPDSGPQNNGIANSIANRKAQLESDIALLKQQYDQLAETDMKGRDKILKLIAKREQELAALYGKKTQEQTQAENKEKQLRDKALTEFARINEEFKKIEIDRINSSLSEAEKEIAVNDQKYDKLIAKEKEFLKMKGTTPNQLAAIQTQIRTLETNKETERINIRIRQETKMLGDIAQLRSSLGLSHASELEKQKSQIEKFYADLEKQYEGNEDLLATIRKNKVIELVNAEIREKVRLEDEKKRIEAEGDLFQDLKKDQKLAKLNKQYDDEIEALKQKFSKEQQLTQEFQATIDAVNSNRAKATAQVERDETLKKRDYTVQGAEILANTVFTIGSNNRKRETEFNLSQIEKLRDKELDNKNLTEAEKEKINEKYNNKIKAEKLRAWKAEQNAAATQAVIAGLLGAAKALPNFVAAGFALASGIANSIAIRAEKPPVFRKGVGLIPDGPSHENGGINLINNATGETIGEMEGGEPILILSRETRKNNGRLINELLYNSQYRNGAPVSLNTELATRAMASYKTGGIIPDQSPGNNYSTNLHFETNALESKLDVIYDVLDRIANNGIPYDYRADVDFREKMDKIKAKVNA